MNYIYIVLAAGLLSISGIKSRRVKRIIGGEVNSIENVPYMLSMKTNDKHICGASVISKEWCLTAAHCCTSRGVLTMRSGSSYQNGTEHNVTKVVRHDKYKTSDDNWDICAIKVNPPFDEYQKVTLPEPGQKVDLARGTITGWGPATNGTIETSPILRSAVVSKVELPVCRRMFRKYYIVHDTNMCYGDGSADACSGDSGGPLVNDDGFLIGITSFGFDCGTVPLPGVYVDVSQFRLWIKNVTNV